MGERPFGRVVGDGGPADRPTRRVERSARGHGPAHRPGFREQLHQGLPWC
ncbi:hypothetical protein [Streptomyces sp. NPDC101115]